MALDFPANPIDGQEWKGDNGVIYTFNATGIDGGYWSGTATDGDGGGGNTNIHIGETPPADPKPGDLWWDESDDSGRLYIYYEDANSSQWVEASPSGSGEDGEDTYWKKSGSDLSPIEDTDNVIIGGGDITLNADGSGVFQGTVNTGNWPAANTNSMGGGGYLVRNDANTSTVFRVYSGGTNASNITYQVVSTGEVQIGGSIDKDIPNNGTPNITLNANGSGTFSSSVKTAGYPGSNGCWMGSNFHVRRDSASQAIGIYSGGNAESNVTARFQGSGTLLIGGTIPSAPNITLNADGSATFAGVISTGGASSSAMGASGGRMRHTGDISLRKDGGTAAVIEVFQGGASTAEKRVEINNDGSAEFKNKQTIQFRPTLENNNSGYAIRLAGVGDTTQFSVGADGSAEFAGSVNVGQIVDGTTAFRFREDGAFWAKGVYSSTNSTVSANVGVFSDGQLRRITSSAKYKTDIEDITDENADKALELRPVWYRSLCEGDEGKSSYGFIAEEVAQVDPRLASYDAEGNPDGVNYAMLVVHLTDIAQRQQAQIETLETANASLEARLTALEGAN